MNSRERNTHVNILVFLFVGAVGSNAVAEPSFDLIDDQNEQLATLVFAKLPTNDPADILSLTFTEKGASTFGFGPIYRGSFDAMSWPTHQFVLDCDGLGGMSSDGLLVAGAIDYDPPAGTLEPRWFEIGATHIDLAPISNDHMTVGYADEDSIFRERRAGVRWVLVPEPRLRTSIFLIGMTLLAMRRSLRRNHCRGYADASSTQELNAG